MSVRNDLALPRHFKEAANIARRLETFDLGNADSVTMQRSSEMKTRT
jgi:hypothetical protein